ncbi:MULTISPECIES: hypothetical protein [Dyadobacter]|uniref:DUF2780 domain-containing protein n=1 Tax=Dyadobacter jiangsuensis TaxID=1591085 RepID=A0A2P8GJP1_9BACT|nr:MULTISPECIES: hypothetical protein [Dyadobacter]MBZ1362309.1 hypothetical protein [Dyadobacter fermentans]PSL34184.1 hypothetical protein CLV60_101553 [Dyadobacter jiangsuensis]
MKRFLFSLAATLFLFAGASNAFAQGLSVESLLDKAVSLTQKGDKAGTADALTQGVSALEKEAKSSDGSLKDKLLGKAGDLKSMIPLASSGKLSGGALGKVVNAVKMLIGANRISGLLGKGESGLLGNAAGLTSSLGLIKAGSSILGGSNETKLNGLLGEATKTVSGLDKKGPAAKLAAAASSKQLGSIVSLVSSAL